MSEDKKRPAPIRAAQWIASRFLELVFLGTGAWAIVSALLLEHTRDRRPLYLPHDRMDFSRNLYADYDFLLTVGIVCIAAFLALRWMRLHYK